MPTRTNIQSVKFRVLCDALIFTSVIELVISLFYKKEEQPHTHVEQLTSISEAIGIKTVVGLSAIASTTTTTLPPELLDKKS